MTNLHYKIILNNNIEYIFDKLFAKEQFRTWTKPFSDERDYDGTLSSGQEIIFHDEMGDGTVAIVSEYQINKLIEFTYVAAIEGGNRIDFEAHDSFERYTFY